jgi:S-(hydroxymethyl)mycothiol dehydrogenase
MTSISAKGIVVRAPGAPAKLEDITIDPPGPGEVLVRVVATGVCHSDLHTQQGNFGAEFPYLLGHEATGVVEAVGEGVARPAVGEMVTLCWRAPCGHCRFCAAGRQPYCAKPLTAKPRMRTSDGATLGRVLGLGTFATHTVVHAAQAIPIARDLAPEATCLIGCAVTTGVGAVLYAANVTAGSSVAVFGCGAVGVSVIQGAKLSHASRIVAVDLQPRKLDWAKRFGATDVVDASAGDAPKRIKELTGTGVAYAFEAIGLPQTMAQAMASCDLGGTAVLIGVPAPKAELSTSLSRMFYSRLTIRSTFYGDILPSRDFPLFADLYRRKELDLDGLVTAKIALGDVVEAFAAMQRGETLRSVVMMPA